MRAYSLGKIAPVTAGTPVQATADGTIRVARVRFQAVAGNTGVAFVGVSGLVKATLVGAIASLAIPGSGQPPAVEIHSGDGTNALQLSDYWVDANVNAEGVVVSYWVR